MNVNRQRSVKIIARRPGVIILLVVFCIGGHRLETGSVQASTQGPNSRRILFNVTVTNNKNGYAWDLDKSVFSLFVDKAPQQITFFKAEDQPSSVGIVLDMSASMVSEPYKTPLYGKTINDAVASFIKSSLDRNEYFLLGFDDQPKLLVDWTNDGSRLPQEITTVNKHGHTALYDASLQALEKLDQGKNDKRVLLIVTDDFDNSSKHKFEDLKLAFQKKPNVILYVIDPTGNSKTLFGVKGGYRTTSELEYLAVDSGGRTIATESASQLNSAMESLALELRHQYMIGFVPANTKVDGKLHSIQIKMTPRPDAPKELQHLSARAPEGYRD